MNKINFTLERLRAIEPTGKRYFVNDQGQDGLGLVVSAKGTKTFRFQMWSPALKRPLTRTIGRFPKVNIKTARNIAKELAGRIAHGEDIELERRIEADPRFGEIFKDFIEKHAKPGKRTTWKEDERTYKLHIEKPFGNKRIEQLTDVAVSVWHSKLGESTGHIAANRALGLISSIFRHMLPKRDNPCQYVKRFEEHSRERFLQPNELTVFFKALESEPNEMIRDFFYILLLTGARKSNVMSMDWREIDFINAVWTIPGSKSKNGKGVRVPLVPDALNILNRRRKETDSIFVFPSKASKTGHLVSPKSAWKRIITRAKLKDVRIHDLRRTMGSFMAGAGTSTIVIGKALGHSDPSATAIYSRLNLDPVRNAMEQAVSSMLQSAESRSSEKA